jgi:hypothetical protein
VTRDLAELSTRYVKLEAQIRAASPRYVEMLEPHTAKSRRDSRNRLSMARPCSWSHYLGEDAGYSLGGDLDFDREFRITEARVG